MDTLDPGMIGRIGHSSLMKWAPQGGITANSSENDEKGWDVHLQFSPLGAPHRGPLDTKPLDVSCMVQVKTSTGTPSGIGIKLSNWQQMVADPLPWFVLVVLLDSDQEPETAFMIHVGSTWATTVLRRLRSLEPGTALHKVKMNVTWNPEDELPRLHGSAIRDRILATVKPNVAEYVRAKMEHYQNVGYDGEPRQLNVSVTTRNTEAFWEGMADIAIGLRSTLPGEWCAALEDTRFGIDRPTEFDRSSGELEFPVRPATRARAELQSSRGVVAFECDLFMAKAFLPFIPDEFDRNRLKADHFEYITRASGVNQMKFAIPATEPTALGDVEAALRALDILVHNEDAPVSLLVSVDTVLKNLAIPPQPAGGEREKKLAEDGLRAVRVLRSFGLKDSDVVVLAEVLTQEDGLRILDVSHGPLTAPCRPPVEVGQRIGAAAGGAVHIGDQVAAAVLGVYGEVTEVELLDWCAMATAEKVAIVIERHLLPEKEARQRDWQAERLSMLRKLKREFHCDVLAGRDDLSSD